MKKRGGAAGSEKKRDNPNEAAAGRPRAGLAGGEEVRGRRAMSNNKGHIPTEATTDGPRAVLPVVEYARAGMRKAGRPGGATAIGVISIVFGVLGFAANVLAAIGIGLLFANSERPASV